MNLHFFNITLIIRFGRTIKTKTENSKNLDEHDRERDTTKPPQVKNIYLNKLIGFLYIFFLGK